jgi:hypothetical protein
MGYFYNHKITLLFGALAVAFIGLAVIGGFRAYSPVPYWDMWEGYLDFYFKLGTGDWSVWWAQHNEHRPVLAKIFFWMDLAWFHGSLWFLLVINYLLVFCICLVFWLYAREEPAHQLEFLWFFLLAWLFSWAQEENFTWGFQNQFFLAQLLPLLAFYFLYLATTRQTKSTVYFSLAAIIGVLSIGSMANGVLVLPLLALYALTVRLAWRKIVFLAVLSIALVGVYFHDYLPPEGHGSLLLALRTNPLGLIQYVLLYLGGPFYYLFGEGRVAQNLAQLAGLFFLMSSLAFAWKALRAPRESALPLALLTFILYIGLTALGTGGGRLIFGLKQALSSRYITPALMAWASLFILYLPALPRLPDKIKGKLWLPFLLLLMLMLPVQLKALQSHQRVIFERNLAALALALEIKDQVQIGNVYPHAEPTLTIAKKAAAGDLSVFGRPPLKNARERLGTQSALGATAAAPCQGHLDAGQQIIGEPRYLRVSGWIFNPATHTVPEVLNLADSQGRVVGLALTGQPRPDVAKAVVAPAAAFSGFKGYLSADQQGKTVTLVDTAASCQLRIQVPKIYYRLSQSHFEAANVTVSREQVLPGNEWLGKDHYQSHFDHLVVFGSFRQSDADTGEISLHLRRGDRLLYRSGLTSGHQFVEIVGSSLPPLSLPAVPEWTELEFSAETLPDEFDAKFSDRGSGWEEWSAIAVRAK